MKSFVQFVSVVAAVALSAVVVVGLAVAATSLINGNKDEVTQVPTHVEDAASISASISANMESSHAALQAEKNEYCDQLASKLTEAQYDKITEKRENSSDYPMIAVIAGDCLKYELPEGITQALTKDENGTIKSEQLTLVWMAVREAVEETRTAGGKPEALRKLYCINFYVHQIDSRLSDMPRVDQAARIAEDKKKLAELKAFELDNEVGYFVRSIQRRLDYLVEITTYPAVRASKLALGK